MSFNAAMLKAMRDEGLSLDACIRVLEAAERKSDPTAAERKRRQRRREAEEEMSHRDVTRDKGSKDKDIQTSKGSPVVSDETTHAPQEILRVEHVVEAWNDLSDRCRELKPVRKLTPERRKKIGTRIAQNTVDDFTEAISAIERSPFLRGDSDRGWRATFDWMLEPKNFTKLIEGTYDR